MSLHTERHPDGCGVPDCFGCRIGDGPAISAEAAPSRRPEALAIDRTEADWHRDHAAYERLYRQGYNPPRLDGCALRESRAKTRMDIEHPLPRSFEKAS